MGIEDFWGDGEMYFIKFSTLDNKLIEKIIILQDSELDKESIEKLIFQKFNRVKKILSIDEWDMCLVLK